MKGARTLQRRIFLAVAAAVMATVVGAALWTGHRASWRQGGWEQKPLEGLQVFGTVPDFTLVERSGRQATLSDLKGKVWLANFIYTSCPDTCPLQTAQMKELQSAFDQESDFRLVSITVDPERDSPRVLAEYAARFRADPKRWFFLTGNKASIYQLAQQGFHLAAGEIPQAERKGSDATHTHSPRFILVDREARIRGYYPATDAEAVTRLRKDLRTVLERRG